MSSNSPKHPTSVSSQIGRKWLENVNGRLTTSGATSAEPDATIVISIPEVGVANRGDFHGSDAQTSATPEDIAEGLSNASEQRLIEISSALSDEVGPTSDLPDKTTDWTEKNHPNETGRSAEKTQKTPEKNAAIDRFVDEILHRFPISQPVVLLFVGSESNPHTDETCARVSSVLADRKIGRILLLDSDLDGQELSKASGQVGATGISDVVNQSMPWKSTVCQSPNGLDFLPCGVEPFRHPNGTTILRDSVAAMKTEYQFVCVSAGDAHSPSARIWNDICDGCYLLISMKNSNETFAKSAVAELQTHGARLLGCVVTDAQ